MTILRVGIGPRLNAEHQDVGAGDGVALSSLP